MYRVPKGDLTNDPAIHPLAMFSKCKEEEEPNAAELKQTTEPHLIFNLTTSSWEHPESEKFRIQFSK
jgi:hypothetical protein